MCQTLFPTSENVSDTFFGSDGQYFPIRLTNGGTVWGASRYAILEGADLAPLGSFDGIDTCLAWAPVGQGQVLYAGTNLGEGAARGSEGLLGLLSECCARAGVAPTLGAMAAAAGTVHFDLLCEGDTPRYLAAVNRSDAAQTVRLTGKGTWRGLFSGLRWALGGETEIEVPASLAELFHAT